MAPPTIVVALPPFAVKKAEHIGNGIAKRVLIVSSDEQSHRFGGILRHDQRARVAGRAKLSAGDFHQVRVVHGKGRPRAIAVLRVGNARSNVDRDNARAREAGGSANFGDQAIVRSAHALGR